MHVDAEHFGVHKERASLDWLDEGVLSKLLNALFRDRVCRWNALVETLSSAQAQIGELLQDYVVILNGETIP